jgi:ArsR family transcriptional regulator, arsenate/arsenite/antimonite-responsive transcriptional repressor
MHGYIVGSHRSGCAVASDPPGNLRLLVRYEPNGLPAGEIARQLEIPQNTMSAHLAVLTRAGLAQSRRESRSMIYRADLDRLRELTLYLVKDCCGGRTELCAPLIADLTAPCCPAEGVSP